VLVVGSANSSNSLRLVEVATGRGPPPPVDDAGGRPGWLPASRDRRHRRASAPPHLVDDLVRCLAGLGPVPVREAE
jgi:4-hydroxy-3-methylbut-2-enyl diphosphate reductase